MAGRAATQRIGSAVNEAEQGTFSRIIAAMRRFADAIVPSAATIAQREALALRRACCGLLIEVARIDSEHFDRKREAVAQALAETFAMQPGESATLIAAVGGEANRYTSYYEPVALINKLWSPPQKARLVEQFWCVAMADGRLDMFEEHLVRILADLLYVAHADFILAKHRALDRSRLAGAPA